MQGKKKTLNEQIYHKKVKQVRLNPRLGLHG